MDAATRGDIEKIADFRRALTAESDRGCALFAAAFIDEELSKLLTARLLDDRAVVNQLLSQNGPLGTFSSRIDFSYAIGLLGLNAHRDLHLVRRIRNDFGHSPEALGFENERLADRCKELRHTSLEKGAPARKVFINTVLGLLGVMHNRTETVQHIALAPDLELGVLSNPSFRAAAAALIKDAGL